MFGYLQIDKGELKVREYEAYKSVYCGLCKQLGKDYSFLTRLILSYDCTFYSILLMSLERSCTGFKNGRCTCNPLKKCSFALCKSDSYSKASALSVISAYYKLIDDINDSGFFKGLLCRIIKPAFSHWRKKAVNKYGYAEIDKIVSEMLKMQIADENNCDSTIDSASHPTGYMLGTILSLEADNEIDKRVYNELGYHLGRWIYLMDAADDIEKDRKNNSYNPFIKSEKTDINYIDSVLSQSLARAYDACNLIDIKDFKGIIENMLLRGLPAMQSKVLGKNKSEEKDEQSI